VSTDRRLADAIADEMLDRLAGSADLAQIRHTVQITSFGGSATTALHEYLLAAGIDVPTTPGSFPFKHQRVPPTSDAVPAGFRVVYPFGDPRNAVVSVFQRGFQGGHYRGMQLRKPTPEVEHRLTALEDFLDGGVDEFGMEDHFDRWHAPSARGYPVLFLRYEDLATVWPTVREFVGLRDDYPCLPMRARRSEWQALPEPQRERIDEMYGRFARRLASLPSVESR
jgi:hypothetical protein